MNDAKAYKVFKIDLYRSSVAPVSEEMGPREVESLRRKLNRTLIGEDKLNILYIEASSLNSALSHLVWIKTGRWC